MGPRPVLASLIQQGQVFFLGVYVDDIILAGQNEARRKEVKDSLSQKFNVKDLGKLQMRFTTGL